jgi:hypothetical protein
MINSVRNRSHQVIWIGHGQITSTHRIYINMAKKTCQLKFITHPGDHPMMNLASLVVLIFDQNHLTCRLFTEILIQKCF